MAGHKYSCSHFVFQYEGHFSSNFSFSQSLPWANSQLQSSISKMSNIMKRKRNHKRERWLQLPPRAPLPQTLQIHHPVRRAGDYFHCSGYRGPLISLGCYLSKNTSGRTTQQNLASEPQKKLKHVSTSPGLFTAAFISIMSFKSREL